MTNVGKAFFPGGTLHKIVLREARAEGLVLQAREVPEVGPIAPGQSRDTLPLGLTSLAWEGAVMVSLRLKSPGRGRIRYYQQRNASAIPGRQWMNFFHSVNREVILSIELMDKLVRKLENRP